MHGDTIIVTHESLASLHQGFAGLAQGVLSHLREAELELQRQTARLKEAESEAYSQVRCLEAEIETIQSSTEADDEIQQDTSSIEAELADAYSNLRSIRLGKERVDQASRSFHREAGNLRLMAEKGIPLSRAFLQRRIDDLNIYSSIQIDSSSQCSSSMGNAKAHSLPSPATDQPVGNLEFSDSSMPLPKGFQWIPLARIDVEHELMDVRDESDFRSYAPYKMLREGLDILKTVVLPAIAQHGKDADTFYFSAVDAVSYTHLTLPTKRIV